jgi:serine/threonine-protein kinase
MMMLTAIGGYTINAPLGKGAMGEVFLATKPGIEGAVALKVMAPGLGEDPVLVERFRREAMAAKKVDHPNITRVVDFGEENRRMYMAMELLDGSDLKTLIDRQQLGDLPGRIRLMAQAAAGMAAVHALDMVHRDLKPANLHVKKDGVVKIMDFGLVRVEDSQMTATGMVMGSPSYMCPEQVKGETADARSDVFSLGAVFYEVLAGKKAFGGKGLTQIMMGVLSAEPTPLAQSAPEAPAAVARIVERCLRKQPERRYQSAGELSAALDVARDVYAA